MLEKLRAIVGSLIFAGAIYTWAWVSQVAETPAEGDLRPCECDPGPAALAAVSPVDADDGEPKHAKPTPSRETTLSSAREY